MVKKSERKVDAIVIDTKPITRKHVLVRNGQDEDGSPKYIIGEVVEIFPSTVEVDIGWTTTQLKSHTNCFNILLSSDKDIAGADSLMREKMVDMFQESLDGDLNFTKDKLNVSVTRELVNEHTTLVGTSN